MLGAKAGAGAPVTPEDSVNRAVATVISNSVMPVLDNLQSNGLPIDRVEVGRYITLALVGNGLGMTNDEAEACIDAALRTNSVQFPDTFSVESQKAFLESAASVPGAITTPTGLVFLVITEGEGVSPTKADKAQIRYIARLSNGIVLDDTKDDIVTSDMSQEIAGMVEGLEMMKPGGTYRLVIPPELGYGDEGIPGIIPSNAALDFTVTLEGVIPGGH